METLLKFVADLCTVLGYSLKNEIYCEFICSSIFDVGYNNRVEFHITDAKDKHFDCYFIDYFYFSEDGRRNVSGDTVTVRRDVIGGDMSKLAQIIASILNCRVMFKSDTLKLNCEFLRS